jgi:NAD(P)-dependent dehydrogenase (short-subunit alcohol dehydrogenase family)
MLFASEGAAVVCADIAEEPAKETSEEICQMGGRSVALRADVRREEDSVQMVSVALESFGRLDVFFANAGVLPKFVPIEEESGESFTNTLAVNTLGPFYAIKHASAAMKKGGWGGSIIVTSSIGALRAEHTPLQYGSSKAALLSLVQAANERLLDDGVRVNAIAPRGVWTPMVERVAKELYDAGVSINVESKYMPNPPEEIAQVVLFLACDESKAIKGHTLVCDGGLSNSMGSQPPPRPMKKKSKL